MLGVVPSKVLQLAGHGLIEVGGVARGVARVAAAREGSLKEGLLVCRPTGRVLPHRDVALHKHCRKAEGFKGHLIAPGRMTWRCAKAATGQKKGS
jgi:hypothetical protein